MPGDPLMTYMRGQGTVMAERWCGNGALVPPEIASSPVDPLWGPLWMVDKEEEVARALGNAVALAVENEAMQVRLGRELWRTRPSRCGCGAGSFRFVACCCRQPNMAAWHSGQVTA